MANIKQIDLTDNRQKGIAVLMLGAVLTVLYFILPPIIEIVTNIWKLIFIGGPLLFFGYNYSTVWDWFKRLSWNFTKKSISSDKLWYLWQGYRYVVNETNIMQNDIKAISAQRMENENLLKETQRMLANSIQLSEAESDPAEKRVLEAKVEAYNQECEGLSPMIDEMKIIEDELIDYRKMKVSDNEILKVKLDSMAKKYLIYQKTAKATNNASKWMRESPEMIKFNEASRQIEESTIKYAADITTFRRDVLPTMSSNSTQRTVDAANGAKIIAAWKEKRLLLDKVT